MGRGTDLVQVTAAKRIRELYVVLRNVLRTCQAWHRWEKQAVWSHTLSEPWTFHRESPWGIVWSERRGLAIALASNFLIL